MHLENGSDTLSASNYEVRTFDVSDEETKRPEMLHLVNDGKKMFLLVQTMVMM